MNLSPAAMEKLQEQQQKYQSSLPEKRSGIAAHWHQILVGDDSVATLSALRMQVHRLAGSAGSYGFAGLSETAQKLDAHLTAVESDAATDPVLTSLVSELLAEFDRQTY